MKPENYVDIIANLVKRVAELERRDEEHRHVIESLGLDISQVERNFGELFGDITEAKRDIVTWSQEVETLRYANEELYSRLGHVEKDAEEIEAKIEMCIDDIVTLDERTQPKQITLDVDTFTKIIGGGRE